MFVEGSYPDGHPVRAIHVDDANAATLTIALTESGAGGKVTGPMRSLLVDLLNRFPKLNSVKISFSRHRQRRSG